ncbi:MAG: carboxypeptidase-like regulatory domain-containing protein, partial [Bacteroidota bacterium]
MKHFLPPLLSLAFLFTSLNLTAQPYRVAGKVMSQEDRSPLPGVAVQLVGTDRGVFSDAEGQFSLEVPHDSAQLRFAYVGHEVLLLPAVLKKEMKVYLIPLTAELDEVVIVGVAEERSTRAYGAPVSVARTESITKSPKKRKIRIRGAATPKYRPSAAPPPPPEAKPSPIMMDSPTDAKAAGYIMIEDDKAEDDFSSESDDIASGQLTAGELNDFSKWNLWEDINEGVLESYRSIWKMYPDHRYTVQLKNLDGKPLVNARLALMDKANTVLWSARTDNTGKAELWAGLFSVQVLELHSISVVWVHFPDRP